MGNAGPLPVPFITGWFASQGRNPVGSGSEPLRRTISCARPVSLDRVGSADRSLD